MITPRCPRFCRFRYLCNESRQLMMATKFQNQEARTVQDCLMYPGFERRLWVEYGVDVSDMTALEVGKAVREAYRKAWTA